MNATVSPKRVLVTGSAGMIGSAVAAELKNRGHQVRGFDIKPSPGLDDAVEGDLADPQTVHKAAEGMDAIIHLAAQPNNADFLDVLLRPNVIGMYNILEAAKDH